MIQKRLVAATLLALGTSAAAVMAADAPPQLPEPAPVVQEEQPPDHIIRVEIGFDPNPLEEPAAPMPEPAPAAPPAPATIPSVVTPTAPPGLPLTPGTTPEKPKPAPLTLAALEQMGLSRIAPRTPLNTAPTAATGPALALVPPSATDKTPYGMDVSNTVTCAFVDHVVPAAMTADGKPTTAQAQMLVQQYRMVNGVRLRYYHLLALQKLIAVREDLAGVTRDAVTAMEVMAAAGQATKAELLQARIEAREQMAALETVKSVHAAVWRRMAILVGQPDLPVGALAGDLESSCMTPNFDNAWAHVLESNPELRAMRSEIAVRQASLRQSLATSTGHGGNIDHPGSDSIISQAMAKLGGPTGSHEPQIKQAAWADLSRWETEVGRLEQSLRQRLTEAYARYDQAKRVAELYHAQNLPDSKEAFELSVISYRQGRGSWPQVQISQRYYFRMSTEYVEALADLRRSELIILGLLVDGSEESGQSAGNK
jgi:hypothetical protein